MTPQELKNSILQQAIQGKLVEQRPEEGTAEELFERIQKEKQRLIAEGKIKKEKPLPEITEEEKPFEIPESWKWVRLGNILHKFTDGTHSTPRYTLSGIPFLSVKDMSSGKLSFSNCKYISEQEHQELYLRCNPQYGDLLLTKVGTTGIPVIVDTDKQFSLFVSVALLKFNQSLIYNKFLQFNINSPLVQIQAVENTKGVGNKNWVMRDIANTILPLPPLAEQKRIVAKIEELLPYIDRYEEAWRKLEAFNSRFPDDMKKSLLQYAIQGKLVEQRPEEGTAEELFERIQEEKQRLIAEGKIKKEKPLPEITEEEKPFEIPESWKWVRLGNILHKFTDGTHSTPRYTLSGIPFLSVKDMSSGKLSFSNCKYISEQEHQELYLRCNPQYGDLLLTKVGTTGIPVIVDTDKQFSLFVSVALLKFNQSLIYNKFLQFNINSPLVQIQAVENTKGVGNKNWVMRDIANTILPLPPLAEQKRIVAKIEELLPYIDRYEEAWRKLEAFNSRFPDDMKKSLLQYAIQGKLVEQRPEEGTAEELFERIQEEKQRLIAEGKIKKEKPLPEITEDEKPFDIPESWKWVRLGSIVELNPKNDIDDSLEVSFIPMVHVADGYRNEHTFEIKKWGEIKKGFTHFATGDIGIAKITPCFQNKKSVIFAGLKNGYGAGTTELSIVRVVNNLMLKEYLLWFFKSAYFIDNGVRSFTGTAGQQRIHKDYLSNCLLPLPPLAEQKRIVAKLEQLLPLCERLK